MVVVKGGAALETRIKRALLAICYSDAEIAAIVNVVTGRFGTTASALTPEEIAKRRQEN